MECIGYFKDKTSNVNIYIIRFCKPGCKESITYMKELGKGQELERYLSGVGMTFQGNKNDKKYIITYIHSIVEEYIFIDSCGVYSESLVVNRI